MNNVEHLIHAAQTRTRHSMDAWDGARSRRVLEGALKSRAARGRRQRIAYIACAASAALFVLGIHSFAPPFRPAHLQTQSSFESNESAQVVSNGDSLNAGGAISMNADMFADGGREAD